MSIDRVRVLLDKPIEELVVLEARLVPSEEVMDAWALPERDEHALKTYGVPRTPDGVCVPADLANPDGRVAETDLFHLAHFRGFTCEVGIEPQTAVVRARRYEPTERAWSGGFANSSVVQFVSVAWRWYWFGQILSELEWDIRQYDAIDLFVEYLTEFDPVVMTVDEFSIWRETVAPV